jgi:short-subunit dehydrogenase
MDLNLKGKIAIVTGGSDGIGKETARIMSEEGAKVSIFARNLANLEKVQKEIEGISSNEISIYSVDVSNENDVKEGI